VQYHEYVSHIQPSIIYDDQGKPIGVVVPYEEWLKGHKAPDANPKQAKRAFRASDLVGKLDWPVDPVEFQRQVRSDKPQAQE